MAHWERVHQFNAAEEIHNIHLQIDRVTRDTTVSINMIHVLQRQLNQAYSDEEEFWRLKSRNRWLKLGERNTKFYHNITRSRNQLIKLSVTDDQGIVHTKDEPIASVAEKYFQDLFQQEGLNGILIRLFRQTKCLWK